MFHRSGVIMISIILFGFCSVGQNLSVQLDEALQKLAKDEQFKHAIISLYVADGKTGRLMYEMNGGLGLSPASCQKVITSVSAFELLGNRYQFKTYVDCDAMSRNGKLEGNLYLSGRGDPTLGSNRWSFTTEAAILKKILNVLKTHKIQLVTGNLVYDDIQFTNEPLPRGWVWEDMGNYYGAGAWGLNWRENQFDVTFKTGKKQNDKTEIISTKPTAVRTDYVFANFVKTGSKGSGDNAYLFSAPYQKNIIARGTVPMSENGFTISGSMPDPPGIFIKEVSQYLNANGIQVNGGSWSQGEHLVNNLTTLIPANHLDSILSPGMDSINYWFLKKSVNLYGEALVKAIAFEKSKIGSTDSGIGLIKEFWSKKGIEKSALKMIDGSGLSPANRVTTQALVAVMQFAKSRPWFPAFYAALPEINGIRMKDGYIGGVRSYTGYAKSKDGASYTFAFIVNNFDGSAGTVREKMWRVLSFLNN